MTIQGSNPKATNKLILDQNKHPVGIEGFRIGEPYPIPGPTPKPEPFDMYTGFSNDVANQRIAIERAFREGKISGPEKDALFKQLDRLADQVRTDHSDPGGVDPRAWGQYQRMLGGIGSDLKAQATDAAIDPEQRAKHMKNWIDQLGNQGKLSTGPDGKGGEAKSWKDAVDALEAKQPPATAADYAKLEQQIRQAAKDNSLNEGSLLKNFQKRQGEGADDGSLTTDEKTQLEGAYNELEGLKGDARAQKLHEIDGLIYQLRHNTDIDPVKRRQVLASAIEKATNLLPEEKQALTDKLAQYSAADLNDFAAQLRSLHVQLKP